MRTTRFSGRVSGMHAPTHAPLSCTPPATHPPATHPPATYAPFLVMPAPLPRMSPHPAMHTPQPCTPPATHAFRPFHNTGITKLSSCINEDNQFDHHTSYNANTSSLHVISGYAPRCIGKWPLSLYLVLWGHRQIYVMKWVVTRKRDLIIDYCQLQNNRGVCLSACWDTTFPREARILPGSTAPKEAHPLTGKHPPLGSTPTGDTPLGSTHP